MASLVVTVLVAALAGVSILRKVESFVTLGFTAYPEGASYRVLEVEAAGTGLLAGDRLFLTGSTEGADLHTALTRGPETEVLVEREGEIVGVRYRRPSLVIDFSYLILALIGAGYLGIGLFVLLRQRQPPAGLFHLWCQAQAAFFLLTPTFLVLGQGPGDLLDRAIYLGDQLARLWAAPLALHLFLVFPRRRWAGAWLGRLTPFLYLPAAVLTTLEIDLTFLSGRLAFGRPTAEAIHFLERVELVHLVALGLAAAGIMASRLWHPRTRTLASSEENRQVRWIALGLLGGYLPFLVLYLGPYLLGLRAPELVEVVAVLPLGLVPLTFAYAILRYKLWDIAAVARDTLSMTLTLLLGSLGFSLAHLFISRGLPEQLGFARNLLSFLAGLSIAGLLVPARRGLSSAIERFQYRGSFLRRRALAAFARDLLHERHLGRLCQNLVEELEESIPLPKVNLYLWRDGLLLPTRRETDIPPALSRQELGPQLWDRDVQPLRAAALLSSPEQRLFAAGYRYLFPLRVLDQQVGLVVASYKADETPLGNDDLNLIRQLLDQAALAIENAQLLDRLQAQLGHVARLQEYSAGIIESSPAGIAVLDIDGRVVSANSAFARAVGNDKTAEQMAGQPLEALLPVSPLPEPQDGLLEVSYCLLDGTERYLQLSVSTFVEPGAETATGPGPLRILLLNDVSEKVALENALKESDRLASLGMLAAGVAHEVNTPITGISSYAQMLLADTPEDDPRHEILKKVERQTFRAARIVNNLLEFARNKSGEKRVFDLAPLVGETLDLLKERLSRRGIRTRWERPAQPVPVLGCEGELQQVLTNLLINATDAMAESGGTLTVHLETLGQRLRLHVEDTGVGIPAERLERVFQPFFTTKLGNGGTGLGLSISYEIVRRHGGELSVRSCPGRGSVFTIELPLAPATGSLS